jgi:hypothetical protein
MTALEEEVARLKAKLAGTSASDKPWWEKIWGTFADDPAYLEAMRFGREYRESLRPKASKRKKRKNGGS